MRWPSWVRRLIRRTRIELAGPDPVRVDERRELAARQAMLASRIAVAKARRHA